MKQQVTPAMWAAAIVVALLVLAFLGWRSLGGGGDMDPATIAAHQAAKKARETTH